MTDTIRITDLPEGGAAVEYDGETITYTADEIAEMERDYKNALLRRLKEGSAHAETAN
jgi:hypothetical protein